MRRPGRKTGHIVQESVERGSNRRESSLLELAARQRGVVSIDQLRALGFSESAVWKRGERGRLHRIHAGVYAVGRSDVPLEGLYMAAVLACGRAALLSFRSAADLRDLRASSSPIIDVSVPARGPRSHDGLLIHRTASLGEPDVANVDGIPCTSVARTLLDLATILGADQLEYVCHRAEVLRVLDIAAVEELLGRVGPVAGTRRLRDVLSIDGLGEGMTREELEKRFLKLCRRAGIPEPRVNEWLVLGGKHFEVDFVWRTERAVVECDGWGTHGTRRAFQADRSRDQLFAFDGWRHLRFTWRDVTERPEHVVMVLRGLLSPRD